MLRSSAVTAADPFSSPTAPVDGRFSDGQPLLFFLLQNKKICGTKLAAWSRFGHYVREALMQHCSAKPF
jgi:hypothetical protein